MAKQLDPFIIAKERVDEISMPEEYKPLFLEMMDNFSAYFKAHPEIDVDITKAFEENLYGENGLKIVIDAEKLNNAGSGGQYNPAKNQITLFPRDEFNDDWNRVTITHEFTHFLYHSLNGKETGIERWLEEAMTEKIARGVSQNNFSTSYQKAIDITNFINEHALINGEQELTAENYFKGTIQGKLEELGIDRYASNYIHAFQFSEYFKNFVFYETSNPYAQFLSNIIRTIYLKDYEKNGLTAKQIAEFAEIAKLMKIENYNHFSGALINAFINKIEVNWKTYPKYMGIVINSIEDRNLEEQIRFVTDNYDNWQNMPDGKDKEQLGAQIDAVVKNVNDYLQSNYKDYARMEEDLYRLRYGVKSSNKKQFKAIFDSLVEYVDDCCGDEGYFYSIKQYYEKDGDRTKIEKLEETSAEDLDDEEFSKLILNMADNQIFTYKNKKLEKVFTIEKSNGEYQISIINRDSRLIELYNATVYTQVLKPKYEKEKVTAIMEFVDVPEQVEESQLIKSGKGAVIEEAFKIEEPEAPEYVPKKEDVKDKEMIRE